MSPYGQEFEELHKLLDRKIGDFRYWYRIETQGTLSIYDIFNSRKVDEYLQSTGGCKRLGPCEADEKILAKRFEIAFRVAQDHKLQNEDPIFCGEAQKFLNKAKGILRDKQKDLAYSEWFRAKVRAEAYSETEHVEAEKARREAEEKARWEAQERASREAEKKVNNPAGCLVWLGILLTIGFLPQLCPLGNHHNLPVQTQAPTNTPAHTPAQTPALMPTPELVPTAVPVPTPEVVPTPTPVPMPTPKLVPTPELRDPLRPEDLPYNQVATLVFAYLDATQTGKPISLAPYCTPKLGIWYGKKWLTIQQAEADIADYYHTWPRQITWFNQADLRIRRTNYNDMYFVTLPFEWSVENEQKRKSGKSILNAAIVLTPDGYRIYSIWNDVGRSNLSTGPRPTPTANDAMWPDGRILAHPEHSVNAGVINVQPNDTLKLRGGPGTRFNAVAEIPANASDISAFDQDQVWDGDTWWCPVEWRGFRGYVGSTHLSTAR